MELWRRRMRNLLIHEVEGEFLLLDVEADRIHRLNATASAIWRNLEEIDSSEEAIARRLVEEFDVELGVALHDVRDALNEMAKLSLVEPGQN